MKSDTGPRLKVDRVEIGLHGAGYRIDKTASPMNRYTRWQILPDGRWVTPTPVCFHALPADGWTRVDRFDWDEDTSKPGDANADL